MTVQRGSNVTRLPIFLIVTSLLATSAWAQEVGDAVDETEEIEVEAEILDEPEEIDETGLDEQGFSDEDDDFRPSEDIPADQSIPFPTDI
jgi:hypothetical protein